MKKRTGIILSCVSGAVAVGLVLAFLVMPRFTQRQEALTGLRTVGADLYYYDENGQTASGFLTLDGGLYYFDPETGKAVIGWFTADDGTTYYFGPDGVAFTGTHTIDGERYTFDEKGRLIINAEDGYIWRVVDGESYCVAPGGEYVTGLEKIGGFWYYFGEDGARQSGWFELDGHRYWFDTNTGRAPKGWKEIEGETYYFGEGGWALTGQQTIGGESHSFDEQGRLVRQAPAAAAQAPSGGVQTLPAAPPSVSTTPQEPAPAPSVVEDDDYAWKTDDGGSYYENSHGERAKGLQTIGGCLYYFDSNGKMLTGWQEVNGRLYCFGADGKAKTGWAEGEGGSYYLCAAGYAVTGLQDIGAAKYLFDENGLRLSGIYAVNGRTYGFLAEDGAAITGWWPKEPEAETGALLRSRAALATTSGDGEAAYYFGGDYYALTGVQKIAGRIFGFDEETGQQLRDWQRLSGNLYWFGEAGGAAATKAWKQHADGTVYLGAEGAALTGTQTIGGALYGFDDSGFQKSGWVKYGTQWYAFSGKDNAALTSQWREKDGGWAWLDDKGLAATGPKTVPARAADGTSESASALYLFGAEGVALTGWQQDAAGHLYLLAEDGKAQYEEQIRGDDVYYIGGNGYAFTGLQTLENGLYYFSARGVRQGGVLSVGGSVYGFLGEDDRAVTGETVHGGNTYWFRDDGRAYTGISKIGEDLYCFDAGGVRRTGWQEDAEGRKYYFRPADGKAAIGWMVDVNERAQYYFTAEGYALANTTQTIDGRSCRFDAQGRLVPGGEAEGEWVQRGGAHYYVYKDGTYASGVVIIDQSYYGFTAEGVRISGWHQDADGRYYYFGGEKGEAVGGWLELDKKFYYFGADGVALVGLHEIEEEDGTFLYYLSEDGSRHEGERSLSGELYFFDPANGGRAARGWHPSIETENARYYGPAGFALTGVQPIGGEETGYSWYWFDDGGRRQTGWLTSGTIRAFLGENGAALTGPQLLDGKNYLFDETGIATVGLHRGEAGISYYDKNGVRAENAWVDYAAHRYWFDQNGLAPSGLAEVDGHSYFFGEEGYILTNTTVNTEDGWTYELDWDGRLIKAGATEGYRWREVDGEVYYMDSRGFDYALTGLQTIDGSLYYLLEAGSLKGARQYGWQDVGGARYCFGADGAALLGWFTDGETGLSYFFDAEHRMVTGELVMDGTTYTFDENDGHLTSDNLPRFNVWDEDEQGVYYIDSSGKRATGLVSIEGGRYYFDADGVLQTGFVALESGRYYFDPAANGKAALGWTLINGTWYEFHDLTGVQYTGDWRYRVDDNGERCSHYFAADGTVPQGFVTLNGVRRYFFADGHMAFGWQDIDTARYYFYPENGRMATGVSLVEGEKFSFDADGRLYIGFNTDMDGRRYYFSDKGMLTGWNPIDDVWYFFNEEGVQQVGWQHRDADGKLLAYYYDATGNIPGEGWHPVSGISRYFFADGRMAQGFEVIDEELYFFYDNGTAPSGPATVGGIWYPFDAQGRLETGWYIDGTTRYYYTAQGALTGWHQLDTGWALFSAENGRQQLGWQTREAGDGSYSYYFQNDGTPLTGWDSAIDGVRRYFFEDGAMATGWKDVEGSRRYFFAGGQLATGVVVVDGAMRAFDAEGRPATGWNTDASGGRYYFTAEGPLSGWHQLEDGRWYCFDTETAAQRTSWQTRTEGTAQYKHFFHATGEPVATGWTEEIDGTPRYIHEDGSAASGWTALATGRHLFDELGAMATGWVQENGRWYHLDEATGAQLTGWQTRTADGIGLQYYYHEDGSLPAAGWATIDQAKRYVMADGAMASGWQTIGSYRFYFNTDGTYVTGAQTIGGTVYRFDSTGYYIAPPVINGATASAVNGTTQRATVSATANAALQSKALSYSFDGGKTWQSGSTKDFAVGTKLASGAIQVKDAVGNITKYDKDLQLGTDASYQSFGIDVSAWQGNIDWAKVKASGVQFAIIRGLTHNGSSYIIDPYFDYNVRQAKANGIKVGAYLYCYAYNIWGIENEVDIFYNSAVVKKLMSDGITFDMPVYIDYEDPYVLKHTEGMSKANRTAIARRGLEKITERSGGKHIPGIYSYRSFLEHSIDGYALQNEGYEVWIAELGASYKWPTKVPVWQYSWTGKISGINGDVDLDYCYKNYGGSSGGTVTPPVTPPSTHNLTVTDQYGTRVTASADSILAQIVEAEMGGFRATLSAAQAEEVFKAQAVAAQTWILYNNARGVAAPSVALKAPSDPVKAAVAKVVGKKMTYNGGTVCSTYFATTGSYNGVIKTNNSGYWGSNHGYLQSVTSTEQRALTQYSGAISNANLRARIIAIYGSDLTAGKDPSTWLSFTRNAAGYVTGVNLCGRTPTPDYFYQTFMGGAGYTGTRLNSPAFTFTYANGQWNYTFTGAGHCIGMSQWGAHEMAKAGSGYEAILKHYYTGVAIVSV